MENNKYNKKTENQLLVFLYKEHVAEFGDTISTVGLSQINTINNNKLANEIPDLCIASDQSLIQFYSRYFRELEEKGFINSQKTFYYSLTKKGYQQGKIELNKKNSTKIDNKQNKRYWYQQPIGIIGLTLTSGVLILLVAYIIRTYIGIQL